MVEALGMEMPAGFSDEYPTDEVLPFDPEPLSPDASDEQVH